MNHLEEANAIRQRYEKALAQTRGNPDLTAMAKRERIAAAYSEARIAMEQLRQRLDGDTSAERAKLYNSAFGQSFDQYVRPDDKDRAIQLTRDAMDRVEAIETEEDGLRLAQRAALTADTYLAKAIAQRAYERRWTDVLDQAASAHPHLGNALVALQRHEEKAAGVNSMETYYALQLRQPAEV